MHEVLQGLPRFVQHCHNDVDERLVFDCLRELALHLLLLTVSASIASTASSVNPSPLSSWPSQRCSLFSSWVATPALRAARINTFASCTPSDAHRDGNSASANLTGSLLAVFGCPHVFHLLRCVSPRVFSPNWRNSVALQFGISLRCDRLCHPWTNSS